MSQLARSGLTEATHKLMAFDPGLRVIGAEQSSECVLQGFGLCGLGGVWVQLRAFWVLRIFRRVKSTKGFGPVGR